MSKASIARKASRSPSGSVVSGALEALDLETFDFAAAFVAVFFGSSC
jgi:hypothetical protein